MSALSADAFDWSSACAAVVLHGGRLIPPALLCPFLGGPFVPPPVRVVLALGLGASAWAAAGHPGFTGSSSAFLIALGSEVALGTILGTIAATPFEAARAGGRLIDTLRGATLTELHVAPLRQRESATGDLLVQWMLAAAATAGGGRLVVSAAMMTFQTLPVGGPREGPMLLAMGLRGTGDLIGCALAIGAPAAAAIFTTDIVLTLAARATPSHSFASSAQPARAAIALLAVALSAAALIGQLTSAIALSASALHPSPGR